MEAEAAEAHEALQGTELDGHRLIVLFAKKSTHKPLEKRKHEKESKKGQLTLDGP